MSCFSEKCKNVRGRGVGTHGLIHGATGVAAGNEECLGRVRDREMASEQVIEGIDIEAALATLDDETTTSDHVKDLFERLAEKAKASSARVARLPSSQLSLAELESSKRRLQAKLDHLRSTGDVLQTLKPAINRFV